MVKPNTANNDWTPRPNITFFFHDEGHMWKDPVCRMVHIKEPLLLIGKSSPCGGSGFPLSLSVWYFTICLDAI